MRAGGSISYKVGRGLEVPKTLTPTAWTVASLLTISTDCLPQGRKHSKVRDFRVLSEAQIFKGSEIQFQEMINKIITSSILMVRRISPRVLAWRTMRSTNFTFKTTRPIATFPPSTARADSINRWTEGVASSSETWATTHTITMKGTCRHRPFSR